MINRTLIRTKVLQILYAHHQKDSKNLKEAENELNYSLQKAYCLYHYLLFLIIELTDAERKRLDRLKYRHFFTSEKQIPNRKFADNFLAEQLRDRRIIIQFANEYGWIENSEDRIDLIKSLLKELRKSDNYTNYISSNNIYYNDYEFWKAIFEQIILKSQTVFNWLEQKSIYWNDDLEIITGFVLKTIKQFQDKHTSKSVLLPIFKDNTVRKYAIRLLYFSLIEAEKNSNLINTQMKNWDKKHIALLDLIIMQMAITEINNFPTIPLKVTLNEYIDLARYYSTPKSTSFINGVLQAVVYLLKINKK